MVTYDDVSQRLITTRDLAREGGYFDLAKQVTWAYIMRFHHHEVMTDRADLILVRDLGALANLLAYAELKLAKPEDTDYPHLREAVECLEMLDHSGRYLPVAHMMLRLRTAQALFRLREHDRAVSAATTALVTATMDVGNLLDAAAVSMIYGGIVSETDPARAKMLLVASLKQFSKEDANVTAYDLYKHTRLWLVVFHNFHGNRWRKLWHAFMGRYLRWDAQTKEWTIDFGDNILVDPSPYVEPFAT